MVVESAVSEVVCHWRRRRLGFTLNNEEFITHATFADNFFLFAKTKHEAMQMVQELTDAVHAKGFDWKPSSLECLPSLNTPKPRGLSLTTLTGQSINFKIVDEMITLGVLLDRRGSTEASLGFRMAQADKVFYKHSKVLSNPRGSMKDRLEAFHNTAVQTLLYNSG
eukprot:7880802-Karenia_brevis.AAC.1